MAKDVKLRKFRSKGTLNINNFTLENNSSDFHVFHDDTTEHGMWWLLVHPYQPEFGAEKEKDHQNSFCQPMAIWKN